MLNHSTPPLGLYIHLPWCVRKCPYCDFNSYENQRVSEATYIAALLQDLSFELQRVPGRIIETIFIGGGTPSLFSGSAIADLLAGVYSQAQIATKPEITLEANPGTVDVSRFRAYRQAGVDRLSIGVQSFRDKQLSAIGRVHNAVDATRAFKIARDVGFGNINIDLMFGLPADELEGVRHDLEKAFALGPEHISWYQLTLEPGTAFAHKPPKLPSHDDIAAAFDLGRMLLEEAGYRQYEISAYARKGSQGRHNLNYWTFGDYLGIGAGAHGKITTVDGLIRTEKRRQPEAYVNAVADENATTLKSVKAPQDLVVEFMLNALRLRDGFELDLFTTRTGLDAAVIEGPMQEAVARFWLSRRGSRLIPTERGLRFLNDLQGLFLDEDLYAA